MLVLVVPMSMLKLQRVGGMLVELLLMMKLVLLM